MTKHYEQRKEANNRYLAKLDSVIVRFPKGTKEEIKQQAVQRNESVNAYIVKAVLKQLSNAEDKQNK